MIKINETIIQERYIIGIGPMMKIITQLSVRFCYLLYCRSYTIEISTDEFATIGGFNASDKIIYGRFEKEHKALRVALQGQDWDIYKTYEQEREKENKETKNPQG